MMAQPMKTLELHDPVFNKTQYPDLKFLARKHEYLGKKVIVRWTQRLYRFKLFDIGHLQDPRLTAEVQLRFKVRRLPFAAVRDLVDLNWSKLKRIEIISCQCIENCQNYSKNKIEKNSTVFSRVQLPKEIPVGRLTSCHIGFPLKISRVYLQTTARALVA